MENQPNLQGDSILTDNDAIAKHHLSTAFLSLPVLALNECRFTRKIHYDEDQKTCSWEELKQRLLPDDKVFSIISTYEFHNFQIIRLKHHKNHNYKRRRIYRCTQCENWEVHIRCLNPDVIPSDKRLWTILVEPKICKYSHKTIDSAMCLCKCGDVGYGTTSMTDIAFANLPIVRNIVKHGTTKTAPELCANILLELLIRHDRERFPKSPRICNVLQQLLVIYIHKLRTLYRQLPGFLINFSSVNKDISVALQSDDHNQFYRLFVGFPIAKHHGRLTIPILIVDSFHYQSTHYDGVAIVIVSKTGFGRTIILAVGIIPTEDTNNVAWFLQMCERHGINFADSALFTDQGPLLSAVRAMKNYSAFDCIIMLCLQHILRNIRHNFPEFFLLQGGKNMKEDLCSYAMHNASLTTNMDAFFNIIQQMFDDMAQLFPKYINRVVEMALYILKFNPSHWTVLANCTNFDPVQFEEKLVDCVQYLLSASFIRKLFDKSLHNDVPNILQLLQLCNESGRTEALLWRQKIIYENAGRRPRFLISKTNMAESVASLMLVCGGRHVIPPLSIISFFQEYNKQVCHLLSDYNVGHSNGQIQLSTIGNHVKFFIKQSPSDDINYKLTHYRITTNNPIELPIDWTQQHTPIGLGVHTPETIYVESDYDNDSLLGEIRSKSGVRQDEHRVLDDNEISPKKQNNTVEQDRLRQEKKFVSTKRTEQILLRFPFSDTTEPVDAVILETMPDLSTSDVVSNCCLRNVISISLKDYEYINKKENLNDVCTQLWLKLISRHVTFDSNVHFYDPFTIEGY